MHWIYLIYEFHNLSWITEINELFHDILIYWDAPVYICLEKDSTLLKSLSWIRLNLLTSRYWFGHWGFISYWRKAYLLWLNCSDTFQVSVLTKPTQVSALTWTLMRDQIYFPKSKVYLHYLNCQDPIQVSVLNHAQLNEVPNIGSGVA